MRREARHRTRDDGSMMTTMLTVVVGVGVDGEDGRRG